MYDENLANHILLALEKAFPTSLGLPELKAELPQFSTLDKREWLTAIDALNKSGCLDDCGLLRLGYHQSLENVAKLLITDLGRQRAREVRNSLEEAEKLNKLCDLLFENGAAPLYEDMDRAVKSLASRYAARGLSSSGPFARAVADLVLDRLKGLQTVFVESYVRTLQKSPADIKQDREQWLKDKLEQVWERELFRAKGLASRLAQTTGLSAQDVQPQVADVEIRGRELKQTILKEIEIAALSQQLSLAPNRTEGDVRTVGNRGLKADARDVGQESDRTRRVLVIHGRDLRLRKGVFDFLRSFGLDPLEWTKAIALTGKASPYIGEILEAAFGYAQAVVALLTPDDEAKLREDLVKEDDPPHEKVLTGQARPNVLFEAGMAFASHPEQTVLVQIGKVRPFSDVAGRHAVVMDNTVGKRQELAIKLRTAGCPVDLDGTDWHTAGDLTPPGAPKDEHSVVDSGHNPQPTHIGKTDERVSKQVTGLTKSSGETWGGIEWQGTFIAYSGPLESIPEVRDEPHDPRLLDLLHAEYDVFWASPTKVSQHKGKGYSVAYQTDRATWRRRLINNDLILMIRPQKKDGSA